MDPERIEKILNTSFPADEPEGMRGRILSQAARELRPPKPRILRSYKLALASVLTALVLLANISDSSRQVRLAGSGGHLSSVLTADAARVVAERWRLSEDILAYNGSSRSDGKVRESL